MRLTQIEVDRKPHFGRCLCRYALYIALDGSNGAIIAMTRYSLFKEVGNDGIIVNTIAPGLAITANIRDNSAYSKEMITRVLVSRDIPRRERAEDLIGTCTFSVSEVASFINGQIIVVNGGLHSID